MGLYFEVQCTECGYHKTLYDGECGLEHIDEMKMKQEFESGEGDPFYRKVFELLRTTVTEKDSIGKSFFSKEIEPGSKEWEKNRLLYGEPYIRLTPAIYECFQCKSFFNHRRMSIVSKRGIFRENNVECPTCKNRFTLPMSARDFFKEEGELKSGYTYICRARCPKCLSKMKVINSGIAG